MSAGVTCFSFQDYCIFALYLTGQKGHTVVFTYFLSKHTDMNSEAAVKYDCILSNERGAYLRQQEYLLPRTKEFTVFPVVS